MATKTIYVTLRVDIDNDNVDKIDDEIIDEIVNDFTDNFNYDDEHEVEVEVCGYTSDED